MRKPAILFFALLLFIISCTGKNELPKGILPQPKMQEVLWDMISAGEFLNGYVLNKDSADRFAESSKEYGQVLQFHHISREEFDKSYLYYRQRPELMKVILDSLSKRQITPEEIVSPKVDSSTLKRTDTTRPSPGVLLKRDSLRRRVLTKKDLQ